MTHMVRNVRLVLKATSGTISFMLSTFHFMIVDLRTKFHQNLNRHLIKSEIQPWFGSAVTISAIEN